MTVRWRDARMAVSLHRAHPAASERAAAPPSARPLDGSGPGDPSRSLPWDVPAPAAGASRTVAGPHVIVAGECEAGDALVLRAEPDIVAHVGVGQEVELVARYRFEAGLEERDFFRVALVARVGGLAPPPRLFQSQSKRGLHDTLRGYLHHRFAFRAPGVYEGAFALRAEVLSQSRATGEVVHWTTQTREGTVRLLVGDVGRGRTD